MAEIYVLYDRDEIFMEAFSSKESVLEYFQWMYPRAKNLRVKDNYGSLMIYNHNTPMLHWWEHLKRVDLDPHRRNEDVTI